MVHRPFYYFCLYDICHCRIGDFRILVSKENSSRAGTGCHKIRLQPMDRVFPAPAVRRAAVCDLLSDEFYRNAAAGLDAVLFRPD